MKKAKSVNKGKEVNLVITQGVKLPHIGYVRAGSVIYRVVKIGGKNGHVIATIQCEPPNTKPNAKSETKVVNMSRARYENLITI